MSNNKISKGLVNELSKLIEQGKKEVAVQVNSTMTMVFWQVGKRINQEILENERAEYGGNIVPTVSSQLVKHYGRSFGTKNLHRMMQFAEIYPDIQIVVSLTRQLSWTHFVALLPLKSDEERQFYSKKIAEEKWSTRQTRKQIERKAFERKEIANSPLPATEAEQNV
ncbi:Protein of unknown function [Salegentibacter echinorum]|uniref:YhcG N-terminal domain-containing protein n=1 Tax=Salegentibacter echinorum TaxID=1073325 RepID=A0A1M5BG22_SALEC|nr:DUF1016 N-terminal domain-containing protein [Salegentibacter echinorum]SHF41142.1 Protein of unknown function [Salegentibacter echinorum]